MRILVACDMPEVALEQLRSLASDVVHEPNLTAQQLRDAMTDVGILVAKSTRVSPDTLNHATALQLIVHAGSGPGEIAIEDASAAGVFVAHCPRTHATAVAELTMGLILALDRQIVENTVAMREHKWIRSQFANSRGLAHRTIGILGYGEIGRQVARRARAFDMRVVAWVPDLTAEPPDEPDVEFCNWPRELARMSDIVTVHAVADDEDEHDVIVDAEFLESLPEGAYLVHMGRPGAIDQSALLEAIKTRHLRVATDVYTSEPSSDTNRARFRIAEQPGVVCTQHIGGLTQQARGATAAEVVRIIRAFLVSGEMINCLNLAERSPATWQLVLRLRDQVGVMASVLEAVRADGINAEEITSRVFTGAKAAWCTIALDERPSTEALDAIRELPDVLHLELRAVV